MSPATSASGGWEMVVSASRDVQPEEQVLLSYGERSNDDFFLYYGFVPRCNPHEDCVLFPDLTEALEWHYSQYGAELLSAQLPPPPQPQVRRYGAFLMMRVGDFCIKRTWAHWWKRRSA